MPQTREHLAIVDLLGIERGIVALTKVDLVDPREQREVARGDRAHAWLHTGLAGADIVPVSSVTGEGIDALRGRLFEASASASARAGAGPLPPRRRPLVHPGGRRHGRDRHGAVGHGRGRRPRDRSARRAVPRACARSTRRTVRPSAGGPASAARSISPARVSRKDAIARGDMVLDPALHAPTDRIDATLRLLASETKPIGAMDAGAAASCGDRSRRAHRAARRRRRSCPAAKRRRPARAGAADRRRRRRPLRPARHHGAAHDRRRTVPRSARAGAQAAHARAAGAARRVCAGAEPTQALAALLDRAPFLVDLAAFARDRALAARRHRAHRARARRSSAIAAAATSSRALAADVARFEARPARGARGVSRRAIPTCRASASSGCGSQLEPRLPAPRFRAILQSRRAAGEIALDGAWVRLAGHQVRLDAGGRTALGAHLAAARRRRARFRPPRVRDIADAPGAAGRRCAAAAEAARAAWARSTRSRTIISSCAPRSARWWRSPPTSRPRPRGRTVHRGAVPRSARQWPQGRDPDPRILRPPRRHVAARRPAAHQPASARSVRRARRQAASRTTGREASPVGRPDFKSGRGREPVSWWVRLPLSSAIIPERAMMPPVSVSRYAQRLARHSMASLWHTTTL